MKNNQIGAILTQEMLEKMYNILEGIDFSLRDPIVKDDLWDGAWDHFCAVNDVMISILANAEKLTKAPDPLAPKRPSNIMIKEDSWTEKDALKAFKNGPQGNDARYLTALYWLNNYAPPEIQTRMENAYKVAHEEGKELFKAYEIVGSEKLISCDGERFEYSIDIEKAISAALDMSVE